MIGYLPQPVLVEPDHLVRGAVGFARFLEDVLPSPAHSSLEATSRAMNTSSPGLHAGLARPPRGRLRRASRLDLEVGREAAFVADAGGLALRFQDAAQRVEDLGAGRAALRRTTAAPTGITMNSWKSTLVSACAPPLRMFIIGTGQRDSASLLGTASPMCR